MTQPRSAGPGDGERLLARLQTLLLEADRLDEFLRELVGLAATLLPVPAHCSVTLTAEDHFHPYTAAASDELVERFDQRQYEAGEGPCLRTLRTGVPHRIDDVDHEDRFGTSPDLAREIGMRSMLALPLSPPRQRVAGVMNLYSTGAHSFTEPVREQAVVLAGHASGALGVALKFAGQLQFSMDLQRAMVSRAVIDQALGVIMAGRRCTADEAFELLSRASQRRNMKLRDVAAEFVTGVTGEPPSPRPPAPRRSPLGGEDTTTFRPSGDG